MSLSPSWLKFEQEYGQRPVFKGTVEDMHAGFRELGKFLGPLYPPPSDEVAVEEGSYKGTAYRIYTPRAEGDAEQGKLPVGVYFHAGGFVLGNLDSEDLFCRQITANSNVIIVNVDYRLAPAHKAPAQLEDALKIVEWVYLNAAIPHTDRTKLLTIGPLAGGALALAVARKVGLEQAAIPVDAVKGIVAFSPVVFHPANRKGVQSTHLQPDTPIVDQESLLQYCELCHLQKENKDCFVGLDPSSHARFPPAYVVTCGVDPLRDDGRGLVESMQSHGLRVKRDHYDSLPHSFWIVPTLPESAEFMSNAIQGIKWVLNMVD